jgi:hypothetical protein
MEPIARNMTGFELFLSRAKDFAVRFRRRFIPYLVFHGQEVDVCVTWQENRLTAHDPEQALKQLNGGHLYKIQTMMNEIGVTFDTGLGCSGRDWEWDWSLKGPVNVKFRKVCKTKEKRQ